MIKTLNNAQTQKSSETKNNNLTQTIKSVQKKKSSSGTQKPSISDATAQKDKDD